MWDGILRHYDREHRPRALQELGWFAESTSLREAISRAALATDWRGKRFEHQWRISPEALSQARACLLAAKSTIRGCSTFEELLATVTSELDNLCGVREMYCYDTALRVGAYMRLFPERVYLHRGTRKGARALGLVVRKKQALDISELPVELRNLPPHEIEDILCIYKGVFTRHQRLLTSSRVCKL